MNKIVNLTDTQREVTNKCTEVTDKSAEVTDKQVPIGTGSVPWIKMSLIGIQIPLVAGMLIIGLKPLLTFIISLWYSQWLVPLAYAVLMIVIWRLIQKEMRQDILL